MIGAVQRDLDDLSHGRLREGLGEAIFELSRGTGVLNDPAQALSVVAEFGVSTLTILSVVDITCHILAQEKDRTFLPETCEFYPRDFTVDRVQEVDEQLGPHPLQSPSQARRRS